MGIKLKGLNLGYMGMDYDLLGFPNPAEVLLPGRSEGRRKWYRCPSMAFIIEHPEGRILFDTGISTNFSKEWLPEWQGMIDLSEVSADTLLVSGLKSAGLGPEDFRYVISSHLHADHAGGLRNFEEAGAEILVHEDEHKFVSKVWEAENFFVRADWGFLSRKRPTLMYGDQEILKDLWTISLPGHTPGSMGIVTKLDHTGWAILTGDAIATHDAYGPPYLPNFVNFSNENAAASMTKIEGIAKETDAFVFPGHDETGINYNQGKMEVKQVEFLPNHTYE